MKPKPLAILLLSMATAGFGQPTERAGSTPPRRIGYPSLFSPHSNPLTVKDSKVAERGIPEREM